MSQVRDNIYRWKNPSPGFSLTLETTLLPQGGRAIPPPRFTDHPFNLAVARQLISALVLVTG
jgi:hypothetical protein